MDPNLPGADQLTSIFGYWPSFHDAEVVRLELLRAEEMGPVLLADVHVFEMTDEVDAQGFYVLRKHVLVTFRFEGIDGLQLGGFNNQNVLSGLDVVDIRSKQLNSLAYEVEFDGTHGVHASFKCRGARIERVIPWPPESRS